MTMCCGQRQLLIREDFQPALLINTKFVNLAPIKRTGNAANALRVEFVEIICLQDKRIQCPSRIDCDL